MTEADVPVSQSVSVLGRLHTIFITVGPSGCGKSTFVNKHFVPAVRNAINSQFDRCNPTPNLRPRVEVLSSDEIRSEILGRGNGVDRMSERMTEVSEQAFTLLYSKLEALISWPVSCEFVVVDSTGISASFREKIQELAGKHNYRVGALLFQFTSFGDYFKHPEDVFITKRHLSKFKQETTREIKHSLYEGGIIRVKKFPTDDLKVEVRIPQLDEYLGCILPEQETYAVIGDLHESLKELKHLVTNLEKKGATKFIFVGDLLDKGNQVIETLQYLTENMQRFYFVRGNHEFAAHRHLTGKKEVADNLKEFHSSIPVLEANAEAREMFDRIFSVARPFYRYVSAKNRSPPSFIVTHAPCLSKYLGKLDKESVKNQCYFYLEREEGVEKVWQKGTDHQLDFLLKEAINNQPYHVFGHVTFKKVFRHQNKIGLDTGCDCGNFLSGVMFRTGRPIVVSQKSFSPLQKDELMKVKLNEFEGTVDQQKLSEEALRRLEFCMNHRINFISGTMSPADKDEDAQVLESLQLGLQYFKKKGIKKVSLQAKEMGSRCNLYLSSDPAKSYAVSRNGYKINSSVVNLAQIYETQYKNLRHLFERFDAEMLILDGELLPWSVLGQGLIDTHYQVVGSAFSTETALLKEAGFDEALQNVLNSAEYRSYSGESSRTASAALKTKYGHQAGNFSAVQEYVAKFHPMKHDERATSAEIYQNQLALFGETGDAIFQPFDLLKVVKKDGTEEIMFGDAGNYALLNGPEKDLVLDLTDPQAEQLAEEFFDKITAKQQKEGVVIKPFFHDGKPFNDGRRVVPYLKVRNERYLTITYGHGYRQPSRLEQLIRRKGIGNKMKLSLKEAKMGWKMLQTPLAAISKSNDEYKQLLADFLFEDEQAAVAMDPRL
eukprot:TRINITY_DN4331_c0_g1_i2.p1 TRINITY_DN4331_c0_g1~~TRINITY_DN4331_c0_g1_i2.p1  ORF type:complete len:907 (-),score=243.36 TRINITY_DN4331_c0_g1_i2:2689-5352(-)